MLNFLGTGETSPGFAAMIQIMTPMRILYRLLSTMDNRRLLKTKGNESRSCQSHNTSSCHPAALSASDVCDIMLTMPLLMQSLRVVLYGITHFVFQEVETTQHQRSFLKWTGKRRRPSFWQDIAKTSSVSRTT